MVQKGAGILRTTAKRVLEDIVRRAQEVNDNPDFVYSVRRIAVFGSYVNTDKEKLGDLDTAVEIVPRYEGDDLANAVIEAFRKRGPGYGAFLDEISFAFYEVKRHLRNRSKCLNLHDFSELVLLNTNYVMIYEQPAQSSVAGAPIVTLGAGLDALEENQSQESQKARTPLIEC